MEEPQPQCNICLGSTPFKMTAFLTDFGLCKNSTNLFIIAIGNKS